MKKTLLFSEDQDGFVFVNTSWILFSPFSAKPFNLKSFYFGLISVVECEGLSEFCLNSFALDDDNSAPETYWMTSLKHENASSDHLSTKPIKTNSMSKDAG